MEKRILQLEEAMDLALEYLEELMGNDYYELFCFELLWADCRQS